MIKFTSTPYGVALTGLPGQAKRKASVTFKTMPNGDLLVSVRSKVAVLPACVVVSMRADAMKAAEAALGRWPETLNDVRQLCG